MGRSLQASLLDALIADFRLHGLNVTHGAGGLPPSRVGRHVPDVLALDPDGNRWIGQVMSDSSACATAVFRERLSDFAATAPQRCVLAVSQDGASALWQQRTFDRALALSMRGVRLLIVHCAEHEN